MVLKSFASKISATNFLILNVILPIIYVFISFPPHPSASFSNLLCSLAISFLIFVTFLKVPRSANTLTYSGFTYHSCKLFPKPFIFRFITFTDFLLLQCRFIGIIPGSDTINLIYMAKLCVPYTRRYHTKGRPYMTKNKTEMRKEPEIHPAQIINSNQIRFWANFFLSKSFAGVAEALT